MKKLIVSLAVFIVLALPASAYADTLTFWAPITAPDTTGLAGGNPGGPRQVDLDHHRAYTWRIDNVASGVPAGHTIIGARLTFHSITNWDTTANTLFVRMLDNARTFTSASSNGLRSSTNTGGLTWDTDATGSPVPATQISDYFAANNALVANGTGNTFIGQFSDTNGVNNYNQLIFDFNATQLQALLQYIANGNNLAFGIDPDCHFWNNGISFEIMTRAPNAVPEPTTMALLGTGLAGLYARRRRQRAQQAQQS